MKHIKTEDENYHLVKGEFKRYWSNGKLREHYFYSKGKLEGEYKYYYEIGKLREHCFFSKGEREGEYKSY